jgi:transposase
MREGLIKQNYTRYFDQDKMRFFKLLLEKCLSVAAAATQFGIHVRTAQKWAEQYERDSNSIFEKRRKTGRPHIPNEEHKKVILECNDANPPVVFDDVMKHLRQSIHRIKSIQKYFVWFYKKKKKNPEPGYSQIILNRFDPLMLFYFYDAR